MSGNKRDKALPGVPPLSKGLTNIAASVHQRLLNFAHERKEDFGFVLTKYALERTLFRISQSKYRDVFILKGALMFELWTEQRYRPTRDADFLASGDNSPERFTVMFKEICTAVVVDDGLHFDSESVVAKRIKEDADYEGVRVTLLGYLGKARIPIQIDVGFGDAITPEAIKMEFPSMLDFPKATLLTYPKETAIAEKFEAMVKLGIANSRMKDFYDVRSLCRTFPFDGRTLSEAIQNTFARRNTPVPKNAPLAFTAEFFADENKKKQWNAFCNKNSSYIPDVSLESVCLEIAGFLMPVLRALDNKESIDRSWSPKGPWI